MKLVIHPIDRSTDFLEDIYSELDNALIIRGNVKSESITGTINDYNPSMVYLLGHGIPQGLLGHGHLMVSDAHVDVLRDRELVGIWCNADVFFDRHNLNGLYTGMMVSEINEARIFGLDDNSMAIHISNKCFSEAVREYLEYPLVGEPSAENVKFLYKTKFRRSSIPDKDEVVKFNADRIYQRQAVFG